jgi:hypothetical protein
MARFADAARAVEQNQSVLHRPGILAVRPGYHVEAGWPVGDPIIVALVAGKKGEATAYGLPGQVNGIPVEVREATPLDRLRSAHPDSYAMLRDRARPEWRPAEFPSEYVSGAPVAAVAASRGPRKEQIAYVPSVPALEPLTDTFTVICHVSPDAGWPTLKQFLQRTQQKLSIGIYDVTSAHVLVGLETALQGPTGALPLSLVLDHPTRNPTADQSDEETERGLADKLGNALSFAWAAVRSSPEVHAWIFPTAYHIKVAVRDSAELWLSSGNWNNSNQPEDAPATDPDPAHAAETFKNSDRDWHVVIPHPQLAQLFETVVVKDREAALPAQGRAAEAVGLEAFAEQAAELAEVHPAAVARAPRRYFAPLTVTEQMTIQPLLTPDLAPDASSGMYAAKLLELISGAQQSLYIQLQYIHPSDKAEDAAFTSLLNAVSTRANAGVDVRIILSQWQNTQWMERLQAAGVDTSLVRVQNGVHNKGFLVDHRRVVISSQNWSGEGVLNNRDAGLIIDNATVAQYFETIFLHDWDNVAVGRLGRRGVTAADAATPQVYGWEDDPGESDPPAVPPELRPVPDLTLAPLQMAIPNISAPLPRAYAPGTPEFRYWSMAEAAARGAAFWRKLLPSGITWQPGETLDLLADEGEDFNAYYDRRALNFFHGSARDRTVFSGESPDIVCHEQGHAILDALRPELFDAGTIEAAAFHESFGDMAALLVALQLPTMLTAVLAETNGDLGRNSRLSRLAEQLGWAIRQIQPDAVDADCLRNAVNSFVYTNPEALPASAPARQLSSEPHSFSRVFTAAFLEALAGGYRNVGPNRTDQDLRQVSIDIARLLIAGVLEAPIVPEYMSQVAAAVVAKADGGVAEVPGGKYSDVVKSAFVRRGILATQSAAGVATFHAAGITQPLHAAAMAAAGRARDDLPHVALSAAEYGLGDKPLLVRAPSQPRRFAAAAAAYGVGAVTPSNSEHAARAHFEDLMQRGHVDTGGAGDARSRVTHPHRFKTHKLVATSEGLVLTRILFDCGFRSMF